MLAWRFILTTHRTQASSDKKQLDVGANLFIGSLDENVDERLLYDTFSAFGMMATTAKVRRPYSPLPPAFHDTCIMTHNPNRSDRARSTDWSVQGLPICALHGLRISRCG